MALRIHQLCHCVASVYPTHCGLSFYHLFFTSLLESLWAWAEGCPSTACQSVFINIFLLQYNHIQFFNDGLTVAAFTLTMAELVATSETAWPKSPQIFYLALHLLGTRDQFYMEDNFSKEWGRGGFRVIQRHYLRCALYFWPMAAAADLTGGTSPWNVEVEGTPSLEKTLADCQT